jgi:hypothetical protein
VLIMIWEVGKMLIIDIICICDFKFSVQQIRGGGGGGCT